MGDGRLWLRAQPPVAEAVTGWIAGADGLDYCESIDGADNLSRRQWERGIKLDSPQRQLLAQPLGVSSTTRLEFTNLSLRIGGSDPIDPPCMFFVHLQHQCQFLCNCACCSQAGRHAGAVHTTCESNVGREHCVHIARELWAWLRGCTLRAFRYISRVHFERFVC